MDFTALGLDAPCANKLFDSSPDTSASVTHSVSPLQRSGFSDSSEDEPGCWDEPASKGVEPLGPGEEQEAGSQQWSPSSNSLPTPAQRYPAGHSCQSPPIMHLTSGDIIKPSTSRQVSPNLGSSGSKEPLTADSTSPGPTQSPAIPHHAHFFRSDHKNRDPLRYCITRYFHTGEPVKPYTPPFQPRVRPGRFDPI